MARSAVEVSGIAPPRAHYSHGVVAGGLLFVAGQVAVDIHGELIGSDPEEQAKQVFENLRHVVAAAGATLDDVVKTTVFLVNLEHRKPVGEVRRRYFAEPPPANTLLVVAGLADPRYLVEVEAIAILPSEVRD